MLLESTRAQLQLADDEVARLRDACDSRLEVTEGFVWVTVDGERNDRVLGPGQSWRVDSAAAVTLSALRGPAALRVRAGRGQPVGASAGGAPVGGPGRWRRLLTGLSLSPVALS